LELPGEERLSALAGPERVTVRINQEKLAIYPEFKEIVTKQLGSDVCYVTVELWEAFNQAIKNAPNPAAPHTLKFLRQHIQLNIGCNFNYNVRKSRRLPTGPALPEIQLDRNHILPGLLEMWPTLKPESKKWWRKALRAAGVLEPRPRKKHTLPSVSTGKRKATISELKRSMDQSMTFVTGESLKSVGGVGDKEREDYLAGRGEF